MTKTKTKEKEPRTRGTGSVYEYNGKWYGKVSITTLDGKRIRPKVVAATEAAAKRKLKDLVDAHKNASRVTAGVALTVDEWFTYYLDHICTLRPGSVTTYKRAMRLHVAPLIGKRRLSAITPELIREVLKKVEEKYPNGTTAKTVHTLLSTLFREAFKHEKVTDNVMTKVAPPEMGAKSRTSLTIPQAKKVINLDPGTPYDAIFTLALLTGMRRGEMLGLEWEDIHDGFIHVTKQLHYMMPGSVARRSHTVRHLGGNHYLIPPKSKSGVRMIPLSPMLTQLLDNWKAQTSGEGLLFVTERGTPIAPCYVTKAWHAAREAHRLPESVTVHDLRHTAVDMMYEAEVPEHLIVRMVGHSTVAMSRGYQTRMNRKMATEYATTWQAELGGPAPKAIGAGAQGGVTPEAIAQALAMLTDPAKMAAFMAGQQKAIEEGVVEGVLMD